MFFDNVVDTITKAYPILTIEVTIQEGGKKWGTVWYNCVMSSDVQHPIHNPRMIICSESQASVSFVYYLSLFLGSLPLNITSNSMSY